MARPTSRKPAQAGRNSPAASRRATGGRLGRADWVRAGQDVLRERGIAELKLGLLTGRLGVSTGSFYYHFADFEDFLGAVAESFSADRVQGLVDRATATARDPIDRIRRLARLSLDDGTFELDKAMRIWATMDRRAAATVIRSERAVLAFLSQAFADLGFAGDEAAMRARILLSVNIARLATEDDRNGRRFFKRALEILAEPPARRRR